jgi:hypothetical protein
MLCEVVSVPLVLLLLPLLFAPVPGVAAVLLLLLVKCVHDASLLPAVKSWKSVNTGCFLSSCWNSIWITISRVRSICYSSCWQQWSWCSRHLCISCYRHHPGGSTRGRASLMASCQLLLLLLAGGVYESVLMPLLLLLLLVVVLVLVGVLVCAGIRRLLGFLCIC